MMWCRQALINLKSSSAAPGPFASTTAVSGAVKFSRTQAGSSEKTKNLGFRTFLLMCSIALEK